MEEYDLAKWLEGKMTPGELEAFEKSPEFEQYQKIKKYSAALQAPSFDSDQMYHSIVAPKEKPVALFNWQLMMKIAAVFLIGFFVTKNFLTTTERADNAEQVVFNLPDHSEVVLNADSKIRYKKLSWKSKRALKLEGEAYFKVTKGQTFAVETELGTVTVVGTQFNVKAREQRFEVQCYEGKVKVEHLGKTTMLTKGFSISFDNDRLIKNGEIAIAKPLWLSKQLAFDSETLEAVLAEIERQYNIDIDSEVKSETSFTGNIPADNLDMALHIVADTFRLKFTKNQNSVTFTAQ